MAVYKEAKTNTWRVIYRYTDWTGERKQSQRRGFKTKREALAWEREQLNKSTADLDMTFASFVEQYTADMKTRIKENTWATKDHIIRTKLLPYFGKLKMCNITAQQIITWQNEMLDAEEKANGVGGNYRRGGARPAGSDPLSEKGRRYADLESRKGGKRTAQRATRSYSGIRFKAGVRRTAGMDRLALRACRCRPCWHGSKRAE